MQTGAKIAQLPSREPIDGENALFNETHFTVAEIAAKLKLSDDKVRKMFENEPGVLAIEDPRSDKKRRYLLLRIPQHVADRVYRRLQRPG